MKTFPLHPQKEFYLTSRVLMHAEHLAEWRITYCHSGPRKFNQRNEGNSPATFHSQNPALSQSWCISPRSQLLGGRRQRGTPPWGTGPCSTQLLTHQGTQSCCFPKMTRHPKQVQGGERTPPGCFLNSHVWVGMWCVLTLTSSAWRNPGHPSLPMSLSFNGCLLLTIFQTQSLQWFSWLLCESQHRKPLYFFCSFSQHIN